DYYCMLWHNNAYWVF
nr:immunoglobulin light chain junction region [Macaca mulatta]MOX81992.1 immunoglobulin light chain junction region [Macaca mulatta]MOY04877.1 immunoglobulin light chain junction region [Macaca mulatta]MOY07550.1 immunoglobulin light chain junction region [Macaca mulatta]